MAEIHELIDRVADPELKAQLLAAVNKLAKQKKFGLVFEEHLPECTPLYDVPIQKGRLVSRKGGQANDLYIVLTVTDGVAKCLPKNGGDVIELPANELVSVAEFGEPIYPCLQPIDTVCRALDSDLWHTLIEADNYHALQLLQYLYAGKVDCIYIDPPYNTGAKDWKYNNDYVDGNDEYRHSKWLSFMQKRLKIAKKLLNPADSMLIVTIDEKEYLHLGCLLEEMFPEGIITMATDVINPRAGVARSGSFTRTQEYVYFVQLGQSSIVPEKQEGEIKKNPIWFSLMRTGVNSARADRPNLFYPVWIYPNGVLHSVGSTIPLEANKDDITAPEDGLIAIWPLRPDGKENRWQLGRDSLINAFHEGTARINIHGKKFTVNYLRSAELMRIKTREIIVKGKDENGALILEHDESFGKTKAPDSVWIKPTHDAGIYGSTLVNSILSEKRFSFPKSLYSVEDALRYCVGTKINAIIVDFFAGSGTTLHAVNLLNAEDGGHRRCILVTNNEVSADEAKTLSAQGYQPGDPEWERLGVARYVTWPRTVCSIEGHDVNGQPLKGSYLGSDLPMADGFRANAAYFKLGFLDKTSVALGQQFRKMLPTLWMKAGAIGPCPSMAEGEIPTMLVLPDNGFAVLTEESAFEQFAAEVNARPEIKTVYLITDYEVGYRVMARNLKAPYTFQLYRDYLDNFRINTGRDVR